MIAIDKALLTDGAPSPELLRVLLEEHAKRRIRLDKLKRIYERNHDITGRRRLSGLPNNRLVHDLPGYMVALASGYLTGSPVTYTPPDGCEQSFAPVSDALKAACVDSVDAELAVDASVYGKAVELCYADESALPRVAQVDARSAFVVYDDTVMHTPLFGVMLRDKTDHNLVKRGEYVTVYTDTEIISMERVSNEAPQEAGRERHFFGRVPMTEYWNNARECGDFETTMTLIDAYDVLQSDRVNDKQQFTDAIFVLKGIGSLGVDNTEEVDSPYAEDDGNAPNVAPMLPAAQKVALDPSVRLRQTRTLFLPGDGADASFITKPDAESGNETLRVSIKSDIHKLSMIPDLTDEDFAANSSGVAMKYKLFGLEQLTKVKERWFREGLRQRLRLFCAFLALRGMAAMDADTVQISFTRGLPVNDLEIAQTVTTYDGLVPKELLLSQVPFVADVPAALKMLQKEQDDAVKRQQQTFDAQGFRDDNPGKDEEQERKA